MNGVITAEITDYDGTQMTVVPDRELSRDLLQRQVHTVEIFLSDGRSCTAKQRRKIFALIRDIADWCGHDREDLRHYFTANFCEDNDIDYFSLSPKNKNLADETTARHFITYLIEWCFEWNVPTTDTMLNRMDDIYLYLYMCIEHRKCAICNDKADIHHVDTIGMGRERSNIIHVGMRAMALCRRHHTEVHTKGIQSFCEQYKIFGIPLDKYLCHVLKLGRKGMPDKYCADGLLLQLDTRGGLFT